MNIETTESFVLTMPLRYSSGQREYLDRMFGEVNHLYNRLVEAGGRCLT